MSKKPDVSVVVPAYNEQKYLPKCLNSLAYQKTQYLFEVIVVDNNSTDDTAKAAKKFADSLDLKIITERKQGRGAARAAGFNQALGEIILSADADCVYPPDWIEKLTQTLKNSNSAAVTGTCKMTDLSFLSNLTFNTLIPASMVLYRLFFGHYWLSGFNFAIKKEAYLKSGGFNPTLQADEDVELAVKVAKSGQIRLINYPITFSGRRFKKGLLRGLWSYLVTFINLKSKKPTHLSDIR